MQIRIKRTLLEGTVQFEPGHVLDLPADQAQKFIDEGNAIAVPTEERAVRRNRTPTIFGFVPQPQHSKARL